MNREWGWDQAGSFAQRVHGYKKVGANYPVFTEI
jgi:hypothetical protein